MSDATQVSHDAWQVFRALPPWNKPVVQAVVGTESRHPYAIATGAERVVCWPRFAPGSMAPAVVNLVHLPEGKITKLPLPGNLEWMSPEVVYWSGNNQFVVINGRIVECSTGRVTDVRALTQKYAREVLSQGQRPQFALLSIAPLGNTARYLVAYQFQEYPTVQLFVESLVPGIEVHWLIYDATNGQIEVADGLPQLWLGPVLATPDGQIVQVDGLYEVR